MRRSAELAVHGYVFNLDLFSKVFLFFFSLLSPYFSIVNKNPKCSRALCIYLLKNCASCHVAWFSVVFVLYFLTFWPSSVIFFFLGGGGFKETSYGRSGGLIILYIFLIASQLCIHSAEPQWLE